ncbi:arginine--tRNA ligase [Patescibacteria group bacterium]|nr:arginine--tRNA ligase [Patescibacteria group bacterium]
METRIKDAVRNALLALGAPELPFAVERPGDHAHGDYAVNAALVAAKVLGKNPKEVADALATELTKALGDSVTRVSVAGPGFINITLARSVITDALEEAHTEEWGKGVVNAEKRVMVEFTDPNPFKEMHIGHLMSNVIGESVARLIEYSGATVARANYFGDVGPHVAKAIWGLKHAGVTDPDSAAEIGKAYAHGSRSYEESEKAKEEIDALNIALYKGEDRELMEFWRKGRAVSLDAFEEVYKTLGTKFDYYFPESEVADDGVRLVQEGVEKGVFEESQGAIIFNGEKRGLHTLVFITSKGTPTYEAKELGLAFAKEARWPSDVSLILTAAEQVGHFHVALAALKEFAHALAEKTAHIPHGFLRLTTGKMSSREGTIVTATSLINDMVAKAQERAQDVLVAEQVGIAAIKYMVLRQAPGGDIIFNPEQSLSLEGDSGPYLQYALVRATSVLASAEKEGSREDAPAEPYLIERLISRFPEVAARAERERSPHHVAQYLTTLAGEWNSFYAQNRIIGGEYEPYKLFVARAFQNTMKKGLWLLGIPTPEKM